MSKINIDPHLVERATRGDREAFDQVWAKYDDAMFRVARKKVNTNADAEEVKQTAALKAWMAIKDFKGDSNISSWLYIITLNEACMLLRRQSTLRAKCGFAVDVESARNEPDGQPTPEESIIFREQIFYLLESVKEIHGPWQIPLLLSWLGCGTKEISERARCSDKAAKSRLARGRKAFKSITEGA